MSLLDPPVVEYRGYRIEISKTDGHFRISIHPTRPDLPILHQYSFRPAPFPEGDGLAQAKKWIDRVLSG